MVGKQDSPRIRTSRWSYSIYYFMVMVVFSIITYIYFSGLPLESHLLVAALIFCLVIVKATEVHRFSHYYVIGDHGLVKVEGIFFKRHKRMKYGSISQLHLTQDPFSKLLNIGTIEVAQFSETVRTLIKNVNKPKEVLDVIAKKSHGSD